MLSFLPGCRSRHAGMTTGVTTGRGHLAKPAGPHYRASALLGRLFPTRLYHLGGLFPTPLYHLHPCRRISL